MSLIISKFGMIPNNKKWVPASCVHGYYMEDNANDSIGSNDGTPYNMTYVSGKVGDCGSFNGSSSRIELGSPSTFNRTIKNAGNGCAYEAWVYADVWGTTYPNNNTIIGDFNGWDIAIESRGYGQILINKYASGDNFAIATGLSTSTWYHIVANVYNNYTTELYINGSSEATNTNTSAPNGTADNIYIGKHRLSLGYWDGKIDQVRFFDHSLTQDEIDALYNSGYGI